MDSIWKAFGKFFLTNATIILATSPLAAREMWAVVSPSNLDSRIAPELRQLARERRAALGFYREEADSKRRRPTFVIEFSTPGAEEFLTGLTKETESGSVAPNAELARQGYMLRVEYGPGDTPNKILITALEPAGFHYALLRLPALLDYRPSTGPPQLAPAPKFARAETASGTSVLEISDVPSLSERGIVEGFYGKPWRHQDRLAMLRFEGRHGMNVYYYAPKDDPYHRKLWRRPYPARRLKRLAELVAAARANFVDFCFAISPGLSMVYSNNADFEALTRKLDSVRRLGVSCFGLFLDDVPQELQSSRDQARFKTLAAAHVELTNRLYRYLKSQSSDIRLTVTPTTYTNEWGSRDYISEFGACADPGVEIVWTGTRVVSPAITLIDASAWGALLHRHPLVWDNFPVNDGIPWRLNLGPLRGRDPKLPQAISGLVSNPMNQARASMVPLETVAEYLWNPAAYDPDAARRRAVIEQFGQDAPRRLSPFLATYGDYWWDENIFEPLYEERRGEIDTAAMEQRAAELEAGLRALRGPESFRELAREFAPFPRKARSRLGEVLRDPEFRRLADGKIQWREDYDVLAARQLANPPALDGDFHKWESAEARPLKQKEFAMMGRRLRRRASRYAARFALAWDDSHLYLGIDVTDPDFRQPFTGREIHRGDFIALTLETAFRKNFLSTTANGDEYHLLLSPGDFAGVGPTVYSDDEYLPPRPIQRDYSKDVRVAWKKTPMGYSADVCLPASWFEAGRFQEGYEIGLSLAVQKSFPLPPGSLGGDEDVPRIILRSKDDRAFPPRFGNPSSYQRLVLAGPGRP